MRLYLVGSLLGVVVAALVYYFMHAAPQHTQVDDGGRTRMPTIIVVGGGLAGVTAAIEATRHGAHVHLLEKANQLGGNSAKASSGMNAVGTSSQRRINSSDSIEAFVQDTLASGHGLSDSRLVQLLVERSAAAIEFLASFGLDMSVITKCGGHSYARTHRVPPPTQGPARNVGWEIMSTLSAALHSLPNDKVEIVTNAHVTALIERDGKVIGARYTHHSNPREILADAVILATGGYSHSRSLLTHYAPSVAHLPTTNGPFAEGEGLLIAQHVGAALKHMEHVQVHPTGFVDPRDPFNPVKFLAPEALRGMGGILVNQQGKRFVNELGLRDHVSAAILEHGNPLQKKAEGEKIEYRVAYLIVNDEIARSYAPLHFYRSKGFVTTYQGVEELAKGIGADPTTVEATLNDYNMHAERQQQTGRVEADEFGKIDFPSSFPTGGTLHVMMVTPSIHYTMGGLAIDESSRVLAKDTGKPIPGLFAVGEVTGGIHGANRLGGNSLLECVVFGRIAGREAAVHSVDTAHQY